MAGFQPVLRGGRAPSLTHSLGVEWSGWSAAAVSRYGGSGGSSVVPEQSTQTFTAFDDAGRVTYVAMRVDQQVFQTLMISFLVIVRFEFGECLAQLCFAEEYHSIQAFGFQAQHKTLDMCVAIGTSRWQQNRIDLSVHLEEVAERYELRVAVAAPAHARS